MNKTGRAYWGGFFTVMGAFFGEHLGGWGYILCFSVAVILLFWEEFPQWLNLSKNDDEKKS
jgi:hypothetical protein